MYIYLLKHICVDYNEEFHTLKTTVCVCVFLGISAPSNHSQKCGKLHIVCLVFTSRLQKGDKSFFVVGLSNRKSHVECCGQCNIVRVEYLLYIYLWYVWPDLCVLDKNIQLRRLLLWFAVNYAYTYLGLIYDEGIFLQIDLARNEK